MQLVAGCSTGDDACLKSEPAAVRVQEGTWSLLVAAPVKAGMVDLNSMCHVLAVLQHLWSPTTARVWVCSSV